MLRDGFGVCARAPCRAGWSLRLRPDPEAAGCGVSIGMPGEPEVVRPEDVRAAPGLEPHATCGYVRDS